jgi:hypothetical protein
VDDGIGIVSFVFDLALSWGVNSCFLLFVVERATPFGVGFGDFFLRAVPLAVLDSAAGVFGCDGEPTLLRPDGLGAIGGDSDRGVVAAGGDAHSGSIRSTSAWSARKKPQFLHAPKIPTFAALTLVMYRRHGNVASLATAWIGSDEGSGIVLGWMCLSLSSLSSLRLLAPDTRRNDIASSASTSSKVTLPRVLSPPGWPLPPAKNVGLNSDPRACATSHHVRIQRKTQAGECHTHPTPTFSHKQGLSTSVSKKKQQHEKKMTHLNKLQQYLNNCYTHEQTTATHEQTTATHEQNATRMNKRLQRANKILQRMADAKQRFSKTGKRGNLPVRNIGACSLRTKLDARSSCAG